MFLNLNLLFEPIVDFYTENGPLKQGLTVPSVPEKGLIFSSQTRRVHPGVTFMRSALAQTPFVQSC